MKHMAVLDTYGGIWSQVAAPQAPELGTGQSFDNSFRNLGGLGREENNRARIRQIYETNLGAFRSKLWPVPTYDRCERCAGAYDRTMYSYLQFHKVGTYGFLGACSSTRR